MAVLFARMYVLHGFDASQMQPAQTRAVHMHMNSTQMQVAHMPPAQMQAGQLYGLNIDSSSQSTTNANSSFNPLLLGPNKPTDSVALLKKVDHEFQFGWKFDTRDWSKKPDPIQKNLYGFSRKEYLFIKEQKLLRANPFYIQWEIDRGEESEKLKALRPWYRKEGTDDSDLVLMSDAVLSQELEAFYGGMKKGMISNVTIPDLNHNDHNNAVGVASNLSRTNGNNALNEAHVGSDASELLSKFSMEAVLGGRFSDSGICIVGGLKMQFRKTANSFNACCGEIGLYRTGEEDELTSVDHAPYDLEGFTSDEYHDTACDLQLGPWQASIGELTEKFHPKTPDCPPEQPSATSPLELTQLSTGISFSALPVDIVVRKSSLMICPTSAKWSASPLNSAPSSESSLPSSPDTPTPEGNTLWDKRLTTAGLAPHIGLQFQLKCKPHPGDARYALLEQIEDASSSRLAYWAFSNMYRNREALQKRRAKDEDATSDHIIKVEDAGTGWSSHIPLKKKSKKFGEMKTCPV